MRQDAIKASNPAVKLSSSLADQPGERVQKPVGRPAPDRTGNYGRSVHREASGTWPETSRHRPPMSATSAWPATMRTAGKETAGMWAMDDGIRPLWM